MKLLQKLRNSATCCMPIRRVPDHLNVNTLYSLPDIGLPSKTSTPLVPSPAPERYNKRKQPLELSPPPLVHGLLSDVPPRRKKIRVVKKSNPNQYKKTRVVVPPKSDLNHLLPLDELYNQPRMCDEQCIVCAFAKPELRTRHHCNNYNPVQI